MPLQPDDRCALIVVDVQNGFVTGGNLAVPRGEEVVPVINRLARSFANVVLTQDWHPAGHASFASSHAGREPFETTELAYGTQVLWPEHCVQGSHDAELHAELDVPHAQLILRKGYHAGVDSYSAFQEADRRTSTGLEGYLKERGIERLFIVGLATDFCVAWTALDGRSAGFDVWVVEDATRAIDMGGSLDAAWRDMRARGIHRVQSADIAQA
ncbi:bifunctional nicotinamidase/pyrazinamidase [Variovorax sp. J22R133]|uniref:bifunctional nicotinamidase/pyrazinamidase n=1 Tax=Variovorax brevis TaxID=3053503 RepID=UPI002577E9A0|nr:bifunctional nicotinamidase/pyrazinamidase [Variovorax sp. J22R133]MDM0110655.1 bifunctional nicotinamidase/pyrazinamidase [Variovorax sp. J22R133]